MAAVSVPTYYNRTLGLHTDMALSNEIGFSDFWVSSWGLVEIAKIATFDTPSAAIDMLAAAG